MEEENLKAYLLLYSLLLQVHVVRNSLFSSTMSSTTRHSILFSVSVKDFACANISFLYLVFVHVVFVRIIIMLTTQFYLVYSNTPLGYVSQFVRQ